jgi:hypothetical protein
MDQPSADLVQTILQPDAQRYIQNWQANPTTGNVKGGFFSIRTLLSILAQTGCIGVRYYYAKDDGGNPVLVLLGEADNLTSLSDGVLAEDPPLCPPWCPTTNPLVPNS